VASASQGLGGGFVTRQALFICMGFTCFIAVQRIDYLSLMRQAPWLYLLTLLLLCGVYGTRPINGARSWYDLYVFKFQPSEIAKPVLILTLSYYLMYRENYRSLNGLIVPLVLAAVPILLILKQPDLGTAMVFAPMVLVMLFAAGARIWHIVLMLCSAASVLVLAWFTVFKEYQQERVLAWLHPELHRAGKAWQLLHSEMAIGSGGFWGKGWGQSTQEGFSVLPERHTDFIFAVISEEGGFVIAGLLLLLMFLVALSGLGIAARTRDPAGRLIAVGVVAVFCAQACVNTSVALGLLPTTGLTLPFVSYGGSSIISSFICLGLLINVGSRQEVSLAREDQG
jgi:rod shape determining protein RodA